MDKNNRVSHKQRQFRLDDESMEYLKVLKLELGATSWNHLIKKIQELLNK